MIKEDFFSFIFTSGVMADLMHEQPSCRTWIDLISKELQEMKFPKGHILLNIGQTPEYIFFLYQGAASAYYLDRNGDPLTLYLWNAYSLVTDMAAYLDKRPSHLRIDICVDSKLLAIHRSALEKIFREQPAALHFHVALVKHFFHYHLERDIDSQSLFAEERLSKLLLTHRMLGTQFSTKSIGSLLGISPSHMYELIKKKII